MYLKVVEQAERIVDSFRVLHEVITVVTFLQFRASFRIGHALRRGQFVDFLLKVVMNLLFRYSAQADVGFAHCNVVQVVQVAEHADLAELGDTRQQGELDAAVHRLEYAVERFQRIAEFALKVIVADSLKQGFVVFVDEDGHTLARLFAGTFHDAFEAQRKGGLCTPVP